MQYRLILMLPNFDNSLNMDNDSDLERRHCLFCAECKMEVFHKLSMPGRKQKESMN